MRINSIHFFNVDSVKLEKKRFKKSKDLVVYPMYNTLIVINSHINAHTLHANNRNELTSGTLNSVSCRTPCNCRSALLALLPPEQSGAAQTLPILF